MNNKREKNEYEIDMRRVIAAVLHKSWLVVLVSIVSAAVLFLLMYFCVRKRWECGCVE